MPFTDRRDAGRRLAGELGPQPADAVVLALPRGGVPVGVEVARALGAPLDVLLVRKLGVPWQPELAMGALGEGGIEVANEDVIRAAGVTREQWAAIVRQESAELDRRAQLFRGSRPRLSLAGRAAILVDDGIATGATALAACRVARELGAARVVLAVPVASPSALAALRSAADEIVCLEAPARFGSVGEWYADFSQTTDDEVVALLARPTPRSTPPPPPLTRVEVRLPIGAGSLSGDLTLPANAAALVVFAHGSGSSRHSPRNRTVAEVLERAGFATLLFDLLTPAEERDRTNVFDIELLGGRLLEVTDLLRSHPETRGLDLGYFGASTGAGAALWAAADPRCDVMAVVSRGGRPDLAGSARLAAVRAPTLLIVGGRDTEVLALNQSAANALRCEHRVVVVPGATHLFEEPGTLETTAGLAREWFLRAALRRRAA